MKAGESEIHRLRHTLCKLVLDPHFHGDDRSEEFQSEYLSAEVGAISERSLQASGASDFNSCSASRHRCHPHENGDPTPLRTNYLPVDGIPASGAHAVVPGSLDQAVAGVTKTWKSE